MIRLKPSKIVTISAWVVLISAFSMILYFGIDSFYPPVLVKWNGPMVMIAREFVPPTKGDLVFHPGEIVPLRFQGEIFTDEQPEITTQLTNDVTITLPEIHSVRKKGKFNFVGFSRRVPVNVHDGTYFFELSYTFRRNVFRNPEIYKIRTESFQVKGGDHNDSNQDKETIRQLLKDMGYLIDQTLVRPPKKK